MSRNARSLSLFLLMLWLPAILMFAGRLVGCVADGPGAEQVDIHAPATDAGRSATDAEGVVLF